MQREIITTDDGSKTIRIKDWDEQYHSKHGAIQEAYHVFIKHGLDLFKNQDVHILEIGFGTGLNALITLLETSKSKFKIEYYGVEAFPITREELFQLNYISALKAKHFKKQFALMHSAPWHEQVALSDGFLLYKKQCGFTEITYEALFNLIYFDAFGARVQPELWKEDMFTIMFKALKKGGVLVTYAAKGSVRRAMHAVGFTVERLPGPPGKREMLRAIKP
ncbi:MAG: tRNA (5-methylaminomethyl-2-thiouridine)(34)-methyltransferase MnmD [Maribacter sp.]|uniref:tRNA (5-methylaminomethyl-2-thiouridine)(34)-methyltransferase MnmD n=1 Tax=Maribacter sp. TaxID=1897614 RepID=UPI003C724F35